ncbi:MAG TPA: universal stress protein [Ilumatobacteraceae bacterium]|nr:universal stress protein [Ilumatobacteraceae bacterium]
MTTVLIAVDATDSSVHAVETAHRLFGDDADYLVLNVGAGVYLPIAIFPGELGLISPLAWAPAVEPERAEDDVSTDADVAETIAKLTGEEGGLPEATALGIVGDPAGSIIEVAVNHAADVIVVGTHERGWLTRLLTSSVADDVRRESPIPVLVVPRPDDPERARRHDH